MAGCVLTDYLRDLETRAWICLERERKSAEMSVAWFDCVFWICVIQQALDTGSANLQSVTHERDLDEFLNTAQLAATDFTAGPSSVPL